MSSRHSVPSSMEGVIIHCGWDNPLMTFFGIVQWSDQVGDADPVLLWVGGNARECQTVDDLARQMRPYAMLSLELIGQLRVDRATDADRGPTHLQRRGWTNFR